MSPQDPEVWHEGRVLCGDRKQRSFERYVSNQLLLKMTKSPDEFKRSEGF